MVYAARCELLKEYRATRRLSENLSERFKLSERQFSAIAFDLDLDLRIWNIAAKQFSALILLTFDFVRFEKMDLPSIFGNTKLRLNYRVLQLNQLKDS